MEVVLPASSLSRQTILGEIARIQEGLEHLRSMVLSFDPALPRDEISAEWIKALMMGRRRRAAIFKTLPLSDPGWDLLLALYALDLANENATITKVALSAAVPLATAQRWLDDLAAAGFITQRRERPKQRNVSVRLTEKGRRAMNAYFTPDDADLVAS